MAPLQEQVFVHAALCSLLLAKICFLRANLSQSGRNSYKTLERSSNERAASLKRVSAMQMDWKCSNSTIFTIFSMRHSQWVLYEKFDIQIFHKTFQTKNIKAKNGKSRKLNLDCHRLGNPSSKSELSLLRDSEHKICTFFKRCFLL